MKRSMMQVYVKQSDKAVALYQQAFDAKLISSYPNPDGTYFHAELDVYSQILALSELKDDNVVTGNTMQFCLHFGEGNEELVRKIFNVLKEDAEITYPLGSAEWSTLVVGLIDKFGVHWCLFA